MPLVFIPVEEVSTSASQCETIGSVDLGYILAGEAKSFSFRLGNIGPAIDWTLTASHPSIAIDETAGHLEPDDTTDTLTINVTLPIDAKSAFIYASLEANTDDVLSVVYQAVGPNESRLPEYPNRTSQMTDLAAQSIDRVAEQIRLYRYDPIAYNPNDKRLIHYTTLSLPKPGNENGFITQNLYERVNPLNATWGYARTEQSIIASFQSEHDSHRDSFTMDDAADAFTGEARLFVPAEYDLTRQWALYSPETALEPERCKRTVFIFRRQAAIYVLVDIYHRFRGNEFSHYECTLRKLHTRAMGSRSEFNPFAQIFLCNDDKPYAYVGTYLDVNSLLPDEDPYQS